MLLKWLKTNLNSGLVAGLILGTAIGSISVANATSSQSTTFYACLNVKAGTLNSVNTTGPAKCAKGNVSTNWNAAGQQGVAGPQGPSGPQGSAASLPPDFLIQAGLVPTPLEACSLFPLQSSGYYNATNPFTGANSYPTVIDCSAMITVSSSSLPAGIQHYSGNEEFQSIGTCTNSSNSSNSSLDGASFVTSRGTYKPAAHWINPVDPIYGYINNSFSPLQEGDRLVTVATCATVDSRGRYSFSRPVIAESIPPVWLTYEPDLQVIAAP